METTVTHAPLTRRSEIVIVLEGGDIGQREAMARAILSELAGFQPTPPPETAPALTPLFALLAEGGIATTSSEGGTAAMIAPPPAASLPPLTPTLHAVASVYDEPFMLAPLDEDR